MSEQIRAEQANNQETNTPRVRGGTPYSVPTPQKSETHVQGMKTAIVSFVLGAVGLVAGYLLSGTAWIAAGAFSVLGIISVILAIKARNQGYRTLLRAAALVVGIAATVLCIVVLFTNIAAICAIPVLDVTTPVTH